MEPTHFESLYPSNSRFDEIARLLTYIKEGNSAQLVSLPGVGRSILLAMLAYNRDVRIAHLGDNQKWFHFVLVNFSEIRNRPLVDATKLLFLELVDSLKERGRMEEYGKVSAILKDALSFNDELVLFQGLKRAIDYLAIERELTIVYLFDRFETYLPVLTSEFFGNLRVLRNRAKYRFAAVFALNRPLEDMLEPSLLADFYEYLAGHTIYLAIHDQPGLDFRISYIQKVAEKALRPEVITRVLDQTAGQSKLTRYALEACLAESSPPKELSDFLLSNKPVFAALKEIWDVLTPAEQQAISKSQTTDYLTSVGLMKESNITIPLFAAFVASQNTEENGVHIRFDEKNHTITKGDIPISEKLTSSEYRLLRYLISSEGTVLEREEIISAVWHDAKSTAGVTDQALDQLIFRLRKKIEDDPNNPQHIQTIKGRGFKFIA